MRWRPYSAARAKSHEVFEEDVIPFSNLNEAEREVDSISSRIEMAEQGVKDIASSKQILDRVEQLRSIFCALDVSHSGCLGSEEMRNFADLSGFDGDAAEWDEEFRLLCEDVGRSVAKGIDMATFVRIANDPSEEGSYCSDGELRHVYQQLVSRK